MRFIEMPIILFLITAFCLSAKAQDECSIYSEILFDIQNKITKNKLVYKVPEGGIDPENPVFIPDTIKNKEALSFYIVKNIQEFSLGEVKYWYSDFLSDTTLKSKSYKNINTDSILNCTLDVVYKYIGFKDKVSFKLKDFEHRKGEGEVVTYTPTKITFSDILCSGGIALVFARIKIGTDEGEAIFGYIFKKKGCKWDIEKRNIETN